MMGGEGVRWEGSWVVGVEGGEWRGGGTDGGVGVVVVVVEGKEEAVEGRKTGKMGCGEGGWSKWDWRGG